MRRVAVALGAVGFALLALGLALQVLLIPAFTAAAVARVDSASLTGLSETRTLRLAEEVRVYVTLPDPAPLPVTVDGRPGFDERQSSHLDDVRVVIVGASRLTWVLLLGAVAWAVAAALRGGVVRSTLTAAMRAGGLGLLAALVLAAVAGALDFDALFSGFHGLFFADGTWQFYDSDLIIQLFPLGFWVLGGAVWAGLTALAGLGLAAAGQLLGEVREKPQV